MVESGGTESVQELLDYDYLGPNATLFRQMLAGTTAGIVEHSISYPFDTLKTRQHCKFTKHSSNSLRPLIAQTWKNEGFGGFYRGVSFVMFGAAPAHALYYGIYESFKTKFSDGSKNDKYVSMSSAVCATLAHDLFMVPTEAIKQRYQLADCPFKSIKSCAKCIYKDEGIKSLYRSLPVQLTINIPFHCTNFTIYDSMNRILNPKNDYNPLAHCMAGCAAGTAGVLLTNPLDVCKTLLNTQKLNSKPCYVKNFKEAAVTIARNNGFKGFYSGFFCRASQAAPGTMACWSVYEFFKHFFRNTSEENI